MSPSIDARGGLVYIAGAPVDPRDALQVIGALREGRNLVGVEEPLQVVHLHGETVELGGVVVSAREARRAVDRLVSAVRYVSAGAVWSLHATPEVRDA